MGITPPSALRRLPPKAALTYLLETGWKGERQEVILGHSGRGWREMAKKISVKDDILCPIKS